MSLRRRVALELGTIAVATALYLSLVPERPFGVDAALALLALGAVAWSAGETRVRVWGPAPGPKAERLARSAHRMAALTLPVVALFATWSIARGVLGDRGWAAAVAGLAPPTLVATLPLYAVWALAQQALFQFYLLGRLRALLPAMPPLVLVVANGVLFGAVHLPDWGLAVLTAAAGAVWSDCYRRHRVLLPVALSHAALGVTYYYWVLDTDLLLAWLRAQ